MTKYEPFIKWLNKDAVLEKYLACPEKKKDPSLVYHYTDSVGLRGILANNEVWLSDRAFMNDSSEGCYILRLCTKDEVISELPPTLQIPFLKKCSERGKSPTHVARKRNILVLQCSFSTDGDNLPMWNYYAAKGNCSGGSRKERERIQIHYRFRKREIIKEKIIINSDTNAMQGGFNIGFNTDELKSSILKYCNDEFNQYSVVAGSVIYVERQQIDLINSFMKDAIDELRAIDHDLIWAPDNGIDVFLDCIIDKLAQLGVFFKHNGFAYEDEYRIAVHVMKYKLEGNQATPTLGELEEKIEWRNKENNKIPYLAPKFSRESIVSIASSPLFSVEQVPSCHQKIVGLLKENGYRCNKVEVYHSQIPFRGD